MGPPVTIALKCFHVQRIADWNAGGMLIHVPGLDEVVKQCRGKNLVFSTDVQAAIKEADIIFASVNTPTKIKSVGAGHAAGLRFI